MSRQYLVAGNWKMNGSRDANATLIRDLLFDVKKYSSVEVLVCPPPLYVESVGSAIGGSPIRLGGQNLSEQEKPGAFTGEVHGGMLKDVGCQYVIVGHSERRALYGETDALVAAKFKTAQLCGLTPILCVGETLQEREANQTEAVMAGMQKRPAVFTDRSIERLDRAAIHTVRKWRYVPGKRNGVAEAMWFNVPINFVLE